MGIINSIQFNFLTLLLSFSSLLLSQSLHPSPIHPPSMNSSNPTHTHTHTHTTRACPFSSFTIRQPKQHDKPPRHVQRGRERRVKCSSPTKTTKSACKKPERETKNKTKQNDDETTTEKPCDLMTYDGCQ
ncbi:uncharacterized protein IWZ02DRAFT_221507 [Phyllosticta citriasiana]|uniref:uncharacterized protein n=1 Tax=Phyllosticta citriasiana TaxID=595635 RepID=UPI0030FDC8A3